MNTKLISFFDQVARKVRTEVEIAPSLLAVPAPLKMAVFSVSVTGWSNPVTQATKSHLVHLLWRQGKLLEAADVLESVPTIDPTNDQGTLDIVIQYSDVLLGIGNLTDAERLMRKGWAVSSKEFGPNHPKSRNCLSRLLLSLYFQRKVVEANRMAMQNLSTLVSEQSDTGVPELLAWKGISDRSPIPGTLEMLNGSLQHKRETLPKTHLSTATTLAIFGRYLLLNQQAQEAEPLLRECLAIRQNSLPKDHWLIAESESLLGECLTLLNRRDEAEPALVNSYLAVAKTDALVPAIKLEFVQRICDFYHPSHDDEKIFHWQSQLEPLLRDSMNDLRQLAHANDHTVLAIESRLGECIGRLGRYSEAEKILLRVYALQRFNSGWYQDPYSGAYHQGRQRLMRLYQNWELSGELPLWEKLEQLVPGLTHASMECHQHGIVIWERICKRLSNPLFQVRLSMAHNDLGLAYLRIENPQESARCHRKALDLLQSILADNPQQELALECLGATQASLGDALSELHRYEEAIDAYERAVSIAGTNFHLSVISR